VTSDVIVLLPSADGRYDGLLMRGLSQLVRERRISDVHTEVGCSNVQLAREECAHYFMEKTDREWAVWIDSDIGFSLADWDYLWEGDEDAVCCAYRKKDQHNRLESTWGFGFVRTSRRLLRAMADLSLEDGRPMLPRFRMKGEEYTQYFPQGVLLDYSWRGEDHGFWIYAKLTCLPVRLERRTRLIHTGTAHYYYDEGLSLCNREIENRDIDAPAEPPAVAPEES
jgi:hypothetical protein